MLLFLGKAAPLHHQAEHGANGGGQRDRGGERERERERESVRGR